MGVFLHTLEKHNFYVTIHCSITEAALNTAGKDKARRPDKLSLVTKQLQEKRRQMKRNGTDVQHIEYTEICKAIRRQMSEDINNYNEEQLIKSLEDNNGIKTIKRKQCLGRSNVISLKEENGTHIHDQDRMIKRCEEFYTNLYSTKLPQGQPSMQIQRDTKEHIYKECRLRGLIVTIDYVFRVCAI